MNHDILKFIPEYGVLLCTICIDPHCVPLKSIGEHFLDYHPNTVDKKQRAELVKHARTMKDLLTDPNAIKLITPPFESGPIDGLHQIEGWECMVCQKLFSKKYSMQQHCRVHGWTENQPPMWIQTLLQVCINESHNINDFFRVSSKRVNIKSFSQSVVLKT